jgi:hypothetical protein
VGDLGVGGQIILDSSGSGWVSVAGPCKHDNESSGNIKDVEFLDLSPLTSQEGLCSMELVM